MIPRVLEPEAMDTPEEVRDYESMDHSRVNAHFVESFLAFHGPSRGGRILDLGTGTARIPIELVRVDPNARILGADLSQNMLDVAAENLAKSGTADKIELDLVDAKGLPYPDKSFEAVISNTIIHHIPEPRRALVEILRLVGPGGTIFIRDLYRPDTAEEVARLVELYTVNESKSARDLYEASLNAALTLAEIRNELFELGFNPMDVEMTSDRHWTWSSRMI